MGPPVEGRPELDPGGGSALKLRPDCDDEEHDDSLYEDSSASPPRAESILNVTRNSSTSSDSLIIDPVSGIAKGLLSILGAFKPNESITDQDLFTQLCTGQKIEPPSSNQLMSDFSKSGLCNKLAPMLTGLYSHVVDLMNFLKSDNAQIELLNSKVKIGELEKQLDQMKSAQTSDIRSILREELTNLSPLITHPQNQPRPTTSDTENTENSSPVPRTVINKPSVSVNNITTSPSNRRSYSRVASNDWQVAGRGPGQASEQIENSRGRVKSGQSGTSGERSRAIIAIGGKDKGKSRCDENRTVQVRGIIDYPRYLTSNSHILTEFNTHYPGMKVDQCKPTHRGSLLIELTSPADAQQVVSGWQPKFFGSEGTNTTAVILANTGPGRMAVMKDVPVNLSETEIMEACAEEFGTTPTVYRFTDSNGKPRYSVRLTFPSKELKIEATNRGLLIGPRHFRIRDYEERRAAKPKQCKTCWKYGHWPPWCKEKGNALCGKCGELVSTHGTDSCQSQEKCVNCKEPHRADNHDLCRVYHAHLNALQHG